MSTERLFDLGITVRSASERGNHPRWSGRGYEIWFFVVLVPNTERALWVRLTRFSDAETADARVWAVFSDAGSVTMQREVFPLESLRVATASSLAIQLGDSVLEHGASRGRCGSLRWELGYEPAEACAERISKPPGWLPLGTHANHPHAEAPVTGFVELDGRRLSLDGGRLTQMHIWGEQRVEQLRWAWAPDFGDEDAAVELTSVAPKANGPAITSLWARVGDESFEHTGLVRSALARVHSPCPGVLHHVAQRPGRRLSVRAWADLETFAGWDYRHVGGGAARVAQSDLACCELELYRKVGLGWQPEKRIRSTCGALEHHGPTASSEIDYVPWTADPARSGRRERAGSLAPEAPPGEGEWIDTPPPARIVALGLTYRAHARETGSAVDPVVFAIDPAAWTPGDGVTGDGVIVRPSTQRLRTAIDAIDPALGPALASFGFMPAMLDYEVEIGLVLIDGLEDAAEPGRVGMVVANDVTARTLQVLGEGQPNRLEYWSAAKSFPQFVPTSPRAWVPERFGLDAWPAVPLETRVNGEVRQSARLDMLIESPRRMLERVRAAVGPLPPRTMLLTGTPAGVALTVPRWKKALGARLDRPARLRAAFGTFSAGTAFLRPGDLVEVSAGYLGTVRRVVVPERSAEPRGVKR